MKLKATNVSDTADDDHAHNCREQEETLTTRVPFVVYSVDYDCICTVLCIPAGRHSPRCCTTYAMSISLSLSLSVSILSIYI